MLQVHAAYGEYVLQSICLQHHVLSSHVDLRQGDDVRGRSSKRSCRATRLAAFVPGHRRIHVACVIDVPCQTTSTRTTEYMYSILCHYHTNAMPRFAYSRIIGFLWPSDRRICECCGGLGYMGEETTSSRDPYPLMTFTVCFPCFHACMSEMLVYQCTRQ